MLLKNECFFTHRWVFSNNRVSELAGSVTTQQLDSGPVSDTHQDHRRSGFGSVQRTFNVGADQLLPQHRTLRSPISNNLEHHHSIKHHNNNLLDASTQTANTDESGASAPTAQNNDGQHDYSNIKVGTENGNRRRRIRYAGDLVGYDPTDAEKVIALPKVQAQLQRSQKTVKQLRSKVKRLKDKLQSMEELLAKLNSKKLLSDTANSFLQVARKLYRFLTRVDVPIIVLIVSFVDMYYLYSISNLLKQ